MDRLAAKQRLTERRRWRTRSRLHGTTARPRLSVHFSLQHITAQLIDDDKGTTLTYATTVGAKANGTPTERAAIIGAEIAKKAAGVKLKRVVFDRGPHIYHGRVKALAEAARAGGLEF